MLDLKLHDIPETVARATARVASLGAGLLTVHAGGGRAMLEAAVENAGAELRVLAVTVLTSLDDADLARDRRAWARSASWCKRRAELAIAAGCHGVVASPHEVARGARGRAGRLPDRDARRAPRRQRGAATRSA